MVFVIEEDVIGFIDDAAVDGGTTKEMGLVITNVGMFPIAGCTVVLYGNECEAAAGL